MHYHSSVHVCSACLRSCINSVLSQPIHNFFVYVLTPPAAVSAFPYRYALGAWPGGGTPHKPAVLGPTGHVLHESTSMASYLIARGVEPAAILKVGSAEQCLPAELLS